MLANHIVLETSLLNKVKHFFQKTFQHLISRLRSWCRRTNDHWHHHRLLWHPLHGPRPEEYGSKQEVQVLQGRHLRSSCCTYVLLTQLFNDYIEKPLFTNLLTNFYLSNKLDKKQHRAIFIFYFTNTLLNVNN